MAEGDASSRLRLTKAQASLIRLLRVCDARSIERKTAIRHGMVADFERCRRAGLIQSANYETSVAADDWLNSPEGYRALREAEKDQ